MVKRRLSLLAFVLTIDSNAKTVESKGAKPFDGNTQLQPDCNGLWFVCKELVGEMWAIESHSA